MNRLTIFFIIALPLLFACTQKEPEVPKDVRVESVSLSQSSAEMEIGKTLQLSALVSPSDATNKQVAWSSSSSSVASVSASGLVTALSEGSATITATADGKKGECTVSVVKAEVAVAEIKLDKTELTLYEGAEESLTVTVIPSDATLRGEITWSSSNPDVATVDAGKVTAVSMGTSTISASLEGFKAECTVTVKGMEYGEIAFVDLKPVDIIPAVGQVTGGDRDVYDHIEHLRITEAMRIRDMMWEYGTGNSSREEYQELMGRLVVGMMNECPPLTEEFEIVGRGFTVSGGGDGHSKKEWGILNMIVPNTRRIIAINAFYDKDVSSFTESPQSDWINMDAFMEAYPNSIVVLAKSTSSNDYDSYHEASDAAMIRDYCRSGKLIFFKSVGNVHEKDGTLISKCFHKDVATDGRGLYADQSMANGKNDAEADMAYFLSVGTNAAGDADQTGYIYESSLFPVGFHDKVLFAGRTLPLLDNDGTYGAYSGHYASSYANYYNAAIMSLCFQMYAEAKDVFELLDMVRSTCLTDYIRLDGQTQPLQLINPAGLYKKYLTPQNLPAAITPGETISLEKGYYKGVLFCIPGAEVKVNGDWIAFDNKNKDVILSQNPMNLEWRLNGELLEKYGYTSGQTVEGQIITVDDEWNGLRLEVPMTIQVR